MDNAEIYENAGTLANKVILLTSEGYADSYPPAVYLRNTVMEILLLSTEIDMPCDIDPWIKRACLIKNLCSRAVSLLNIMLLDNYAGRVVVAVLKSDISRIVYISDKLLRNPFRV